MIENKNFIFVEEIFTENSMSSSEPKLSWFKIHSPAIAWTINFFNYSLIYHDGYDLIAFTESDYLHCTIYHGAICSLYHIM